jgi:PmbA protein
MIDEKQCRQWFAEAARAATRIGARGVEVMVAARGEALTRFANNAIHQNVAEQTRTLSVRVVVGKATARASTNRVDREGIRAAAQQACEMARASGPSPEFAVIASPTKVPLVKRYDEATETMSARSRAEAVREMIAAVEDAGQTAAGIYATESGVEAIYNTAGVAAFHAETLAQVSITAMAGDSSGWAKATEMSAAALDHAGLARRAARKAALSRAPREVPPGRYTVILEPAAVLDLVGQIFPDFSATSVDDKRSFLNDRLAEQLFGQNITIVDDVTHPLTMGAPFDGEGLGRQTVTLVENGVPNQLVTSRASAQRHGAQATGHGFPIPNEAGEAPVNIVIAGGEMSVEEMIASTERGILVTRLWYIREVDPYEKVMTGMTRDGTFWVEGGEVAYGLKNFRFNESVVSMLGRVEALSATARASGEETFDMVAPAMKVRDFAFTEITKF